MSSFNGKEVLNEHRDNDVACLVTTGAMDSANVPSLQFESIQTSRVTLCGWPLRNVCSPPSPLHVLLAAVLLVFSASRGITTHVQCAVQQAGRIKAVDIYSDHLGQIRGHVTAGCYYSRAAA